MSNRRRKTHSDSFCFPPPLPTLPSLNGLAVPSKGTNVGTPAGVRDNFPVRGGQGLSHEEAEKIKQELLQQARSEFQENFEAIIHEKTRRNFEGVENRLDELEASMETVVTVDWITQIKDSIEKLEEKNEEIDLGLDSIKRDVHFWKRRVDFTRENVESGFRTLRSEIQTQLSSLRSKIQGIEAGLGVVISVFVNNLQLLFFGLQRLSLQIIEIEKTQYNSNKKTETFITRLEALRMTLSVLEEQFDLVATSRADLEKTIQKSRVVVASQIVERFAEKEQPLHYALSRVDNSDEDSLQIYEVFNRRSSALLNHGRQMVYSSGVSSGIPVVLTIPKKGTIATIHLCKNDGFDATVYRLDVSQNPIENPNAITGLFSGKFFDTKKEQERLVYSIQKEPVVQEAAARLAIALSETTSTGQSPSVVWPELRDLFHMTSEIINAGMSSIYSQAIALSNQTTSVVMSAATERVAVLKYEPTEYETSELATVESGSKTIEQDQSDLQTVEGIAAVQRQCSNLVEKAAIEVLESEELIIQTSKVTEVALEEPKEPNSAILALNETSGSFASLEETADELMAQEKIPDLDLIYKAFDDSIEDSNITPEYLKRLVKDQFSSSPYTEDDIELLYNTLLQAVQEHRKEESEEESVADDSELGLAEESYSGSSVAEKVDYAGGDEENAGLWLNIDSAHYYYSRQDDGSLFVRSEADLTDIERYCAQILDATDNNYGVLAADLTRKHASFYDFSLGRDYIRDGFTDNQKHDALAEACDDAKIKYFEEDYEKKFSTLTGDELYNDLYVPIGTEVSKKTNPSQYGDKNYISSILDEIENKLPPDFVSNPAHKAVALYKLKGRLKSEYKDAYKRTTLEKQMNIRISLAMLEWVGLWGDLPTKSLDEDGSEWQKRIEEAFLRTLETYKNSVVKADNKTAVVDVFYNYVNKSYSKVAFVLERLKKRTIFDKDEQSYLDSLIKYAHMKYVLSKISRFPPMQPETYEETFQYIQAHFNATVEELTNLFYFVFVETGEVEGQGYSDAYKRTARKAFFKYVSDNSSINLDLSDDFFLKKSGKLKQAVANARKDAIRLYKDEKAALLEKSLLANNPFAATRASGDSDDDE